ncbi:MAG: hypothetical protein MJY89_07040 [Bacteroidales bacterium]|nr:hypothetical protein [Bacteroidales bacterium]
MSLLNFILFAMLDIIPGGQAFMNCLQERDSILVADQIEYGFRIDDVKPGVTFALPDFEQVSNDTLTLVRNWQIDTLSSGKAVSGKALQKLLKNKKPLGIRGSIVLAPFEEGHYALPTIPVQRTAAGKTDTLLFDGLEIDVKTMPVDTATFEIHDIKGQIRYPVTFAEIAPWVAAVALLAALIVLAVYLVRRRRAARSGLAEAQRDPAYIVALRELEKYRGDKFWAPEKQKAFYSGITDTLKFYIEDRFGVDAPEMTTGELFAALKNCKDLTPDLYEEARELFECADFVKFAKHTASDEDNAKAVPVAVRFVTSTFQAESEDAVRNDGEEAVAK